MPRPSRKNQIRDAALACFAEDGFAATRLRTVAARAGVSEPAIYRHYESLSELAAELYLESFTLYAESIQRVIGDAEGEEQKLRALVRETLRLYRSMPDAFVFTLEVLPAFLRRLPAEFPLPLGQIATVIAAGQHKEVMRRGSPALLASILLGAVTRPIATERLAPEGMIVILRDRSSDVTIEDAALAAVLA